MMNSFVRKALVNNQHHIISLIRNNNYCYFFLTKDGKQQQRTLSIITQKIEDKDIHQHELDCNATIDRICNGSFDDYHMNTKLSLKVELKNQKSNSINVHFKIKEEKNFDNDMIRKSESGKYSLQAKDTSSNNSISPSITGSICKQNSDNYDSLPLWSTDSMQTHTTSTSWQNYLSIPIEQKYQHEFYIMKVIDGDTIYAKRVNSRKNEEIKIRIIGIDCPEKNEPYFEEAKDFVEKYCLNKKIILTYTDNDKDLHNRLLASVWFVNQNIEDTDTTSSKTSYSNLSEAIVHAGLAIAYYPSKHHDKNILINLQRIAKMQNKGIWKNFRDQEVYVNPGAGINAFHRSVCPRYLKQEAKKMTLASTCLDKGLNPCRQCNPDIFCVS